MEIMIHDVLHVVSGDASGADLGFGEGGGLKKRMRAQSAWHFLKILHDIHYLPCAPLDHRYYIDQLTTYRMTNRLMYRKIFNYFCSVIFLKNQSKHHVIQLQYID